MDEIVRRGYATASTDTGHRTTDNWWAVGHPEKAADYLYRETQIRFGVSHHTFENALDIILLG